VSIARINGPRRVHRHSLEFKLKAVRLSQIEGVLVRDVAHALDVHPFMLSRWRGQVRTGRLTPRAEVQVPPRASREMKQLSALRRDYALLREEHELLKKAIRFCSARRPTRSPSSSRSRTGSA